MCRVHHGPGLLVADQRENARREFQHRHLDSQLRRRGGHLEANQSPADDEEIPAASQSRLQRSGIRIGTQIVHARHTDRELWNLARSRPCGNHQGVVMQPAPIVQHDRAIETIDRRAPRERLQHDIMTGDAARTGNQRVAGHHVAEQHRFRKRRLFVRLAGLQREERNGGGRVLFLGRDGRERAGRATADYQDGAHFRLVGGLDPPDPRDLTLG